MLSFGENNWIQYGWSKYLNRVRTRGDNFYINFTLKKPIQISQPALEIAINCVEKISKTYPPPYTLMCSGGTDSQAMIYAWLKSSVPFNVMSIKYISNDTWWNQHDLCTLEEFASINRLTVEFKNFDVIHFLENELDYIANTYECPSPQISTHIKITDLAPSGTIMFSGNFIRAGTPIELSPALMGIHKFSLYKDRKDISIIPFFFLEFPELAYAFDDTRYKDKDQLYLKNGFPIIQPIQKFTGFEELKNFYDKYPTRVIAKDRLKFSNKPSNRVFDLLFRYPYEGVENYRVFHLTCKE
jgi:hypothetical protein